MKTCMEKKPLSASLTRLATNVAAEVIIITSNVFDFAVVKTLHYQLEHGLERLC